VISPSSGLTEKVYEYPGSLLVWRHATETGEASLHLFGEVAHVLNFFTGRVDSSRPVPADPLALRTLQWAASVSECKRLVLHTMEPADYTTPAGVRLLERAELDEPNPMREGEILSDVELVIDRTEFDRLSPDEQLGRLIAKVTDDDQFVDCHRCKRSWPVERAPQFRGGRCLDCWEHPPLGPDPSTLPLEGEQPGPFGGDDTL
jgi:hypothetical protein